MNVVESPEAQPSRPVKVSAPVVSPVSVKVRDSWFQPPPPQSRAAGCRHRSGSTATATRRCRWRCSRSCRSSAGRRRPCSRSRASRPRCWAPRRCRRSRTSRRRGCRSGPGWWAPGRHARRQQEPSLGRQGVRTGDFDHAVGRAGRQEAERGMANEPGQTEVRPGRRAFTSRAARDMVGGFPLTISLAAWSPSLSSDGRGSMPWRGRIQRGR
jgi:hypothetical protein